MTREEIKKTALKMAQENGLINLTRHDLCNKVGIPDGSWLNVMDCTFQELVQELKSKITGKSHHPVNKSRVEANLRREQILNAAIDIAKKIGYHKMTRGNIADEAGVSMALITLRLGSMVDIRRTVMRAAIKQSVPEIIAQGLANSDIHAKKAPPELKEKAATILANL